MARVIQPTHVIRLKKNNKNQYECWGFRWHIPVPRKRKTACGIIINPNIQDWERSSFDGVGSTSLCAGCFKGLVVSDRKGKVRRY